MFDKEPFKSVEYYDMRVENASLLAQVASQILDNILDEDSNYISLVFVVVCTFVVVVSNVLSIFLPVMIVADELIQFIYSYNQDHDHDHFVLKNVIVSLFDMFIHNLTMDDQIKYVILILNVLVLIWCMIYCVVYVFPFYYYLWNVSYNVDNLVGIQLVTRNDGYSLSAYFSRYHHLQSIIHDIYLTYYCLKQFPCQSRYIAQIFGKDIATVIISYVGNAYEQIASTWYLNRHDY